MLLCCLLSEWLLIFSLIIVIDDIIKTSHYIETSDRIRLSKKKVIPDRTTVSHVHLCLKHASLLKVPTDSRCLHEASIYNMQLLTYFEVDMECY